MQELIRVETNENMEPIISGRELHERLEVKSKYNDWIKRMLEYGFTEGVDFTLFTQKKVSSNASGFKTITDHILKLDMAKEIAMIQRNEKGKQIRKYFIEVEKEFNSPERIIQRALVYANNQIDTLKLESKIKDQQIAELKPKADYTDIILKNKGLVTVSQIAKDYGMSGNALNKILNALKIQYKQSGQWLLYAKYQNNGYTHSETIPLLGVNGFDIVSMHTKWTQKGRLFLYELLKENNILPKIEQN
ncbi:phage antirepressor KilAC domain-containing protein [Peptostreptococcus faecalis]|uniref:phage antirepressor KilAC domain-containing protein n=1 Tax=Peptostreptococcus faecalis TaxID=2045015 RepID=UPI000C7B20C4|nr:phage antirepressor KilAC domain-containing protein [Peptostreptococcus faecalis]